MAVRVNKNSAHPPLIPLLHNESKEERSDDIASEGDVVVVRMVDESENVFRATVDGFWQKEGLEKREYHEEC